MLLISFENVPLGSRIRYQKSSKIWTVISKYRKEDGKRLFGILAEWRSDMEKFGKWPGQSIVSHIPDDQEGDCPEMVEFVN